MIRKEPADWVFFNVSMRDNDGEAVAIYQNKVIDIGSIPYIFSNYRGFKDYNAQGFSIGTAKDRVQLGDSAEGIAVYVDELQPETIIWEIKDGVCVERNTDLLDPHWDDH